MFLIYYVKELSRIQVIQQWNGAESQEQDCYDPSGQADRERPRVCLGRNQHLVESCMGQQQKSLPTLYDFYTNWLHHSGTQLPLLLCLYNGINIIFPEVMPQSLPDIW